MAVSEEKLAEKLGQLYAKHEEFENGQNIVDDNMNDKLFLLVELANAECEIDELKEMMRKILE